MPGHQDVTPAAVLAPVPAAMAKPKFLLLRNAPWLPHPETSPDVAQEGGAALWMGKD